jgi:hypothetical protein
MALRSKVTAVFGIAVLSACAQHTPTHVVNARAAQCTARATSLIAANVSVIAQHHYSAASRAAERAARISLACVATDSTIVQFDDRWRAANAFVVAAELAHQANDQLRARRLLHEGYNIMHALRPPDHVSALTSTLIAQKLDTARRDLHGQWVYW